MLKRAWGQLMVCLYRAGKPAAALDAYRSVRSVLGEDLGLEPGPELVELERQVLMHDDRLLAQHRRVRERVHRCEAGRSRSRNQPSSPLPW